MRRLMLLRHAKTETDAPSGRDFDRRLDTRGLSDAEQMGHWLANETSRPSRILVSAAIRTKQTWETVASVLPEMPEAMVVARLYQATPNDLMLAIREHGGEATPLLIVAHNPALHEIAIALTGSGDAAARKILDTNLPTCGLVILDFEAASWDEIGFRQGHLQTLVSPKILRDKVHQGK